MTRRTLLAALACAALLPLALDGQRPGVRSPPPALGEHTTALLAGLGYTPGEISALRQAGVVGGGPAATGAPGESDATSPR